MLRKILNIKKLLLLLGGGVLIMATITGCSNVFNKPSDKEIVNKFAEFVNMFPTEDLTVLYDKEGNRSNFKAGDLGTWVVSSYLDTSDEDKSKTSGVVLRFNRNTKQAQGTFYMTLYKDKEVVEDMEYPIYYDKDGIYLVDENIEESVVDELSNFKIMYEFLSLDMEYLNDLEPERIFYNEEVPLYGATYKLTADDKNIKKIKGLYPNIPIDDNNLTLDLRGNGTQWENTGYLSLSLHLDDKDNNYLSTIISFKNSSEVEDFAIGE